MKLEQHLKKMKALEAKPTYRTLEEKCQQLRELATGLLNELRGVIGYFEDNWAIDTGAIKETMVYAKTVLKVEDEDPAQSS